MNAQHTIGEPEELASLYLAGAMTPEQADEFGAHLRACDACRSALADLSDVGALLAAGLPQAEPPASARSAILARISQTDVAATDHAADEETQVWKGWPDDATSGILIRRAGDTAWEDTSVAGVRVRRLFTDRARNQATMLVEMRAGTSYPRHVHASGEECYVLQGDLRMGDDVLHAGDYQYAAPGSLHGVQSTERGCLLLIVSSLSDELV